MKKQLLLLLFSLFAIQLIAQKFTISGYISDGETGERLINANVYDQKSLKGTTANNFGFYSLTHPAGATNVVVSFIGYAPRLFSLDLKRDTIINIKLALDSDILNEINVVGTKSKVEETQMSVIDVPIQKLQKIPVILGESDVLKVMQLLPGVKGGTEGTSGIYVRGGGPDQNLFLLDGVPVYNASHLLGFFSVFNPDAIKAIKLYKGGFPARYGGRLSSVVDITMKDGNMKKLEGNFSIGLISSKLSFEGPLIKDKTSFIISARRTYLDVLTTPLIAYTNKKFGDDVSGGAYFHDFNLKLNHIFSDRSRLYFSGYMGKDKGYSSSEYKVYADNKRETAIGKKGNQFGLGWGNSIASLRWNYLINKKLFSNTTLTYSKYNFDVLVNNSETYFQDSTKIANIYNYHSGIEDIAAKIDFDYFPITGHEVKFGSNFTKHHFTPGVTNEKFENTVTDLTEVMDTIYGNRDIFANEFTGYIEDNITLSESLSMNAGLHVSLFNVQDENYLRFQPRMSVRYKPSKKFSLKASYSRMAQHVHLLTTSGISMPTDLWLPVTKEFEPPISDQIAIGAVINLPKDFTFSVEGYYKSMKNLIEYKEGASFTNNQTDWENKVEKGNGWSYGAEFMLEKNVGKTTGWIAYTLSWSNRQFENLNFGKVFPAKYDSRHDISIAVTHEFSKKFDIGATWVYNTGNAVTLATMQYPIRNTTGSNNSGDNLYDDYNSIQDYGGRNNYRMPAYHRMDFGANFHKQKKHGVRTWSISAYNAYNRKNPFYLQWNNKSEEMEKQEDGSHRIVKPARTVLSQYSLFPLIPSISYSFKF